MVDFLNKYLINRHYKALTLFTFYANIRALNIVVEDGCYKGWFDIISNIEYQFIIL